MAKSSKPKATTSESVSTKPFQILSKWKQKAQEMATLVQLLRNELAKGAKNIDLILQLVEDMLDKSKSFKTEAKTATPVPKEATEPV